MMMIIIIISQHLPRYCLWPPRYGNPPIYFSFQPKFIGRCLPTAVQYHTASRCNKTFNFSLGRLELIVGWETVTVDPIKLNHSVIPSAHVYVIMVVVDMAFDKMYDKRREKTSIWEKQAKSTIKRIYFIVSTEIMAFFFHCRVILLH